MFHFKENIIFRFNLLVLFAFVVWGGIIIAQASFLMLQKDFWKEVEDLQVATNIPIPATRGNILSDNGELLVCNHVKYNIYIDFDYTDKNPEVQKKVLFEKDTLWENNVTKLSKELSEVVPRWSAKEYEQHLRRGMELQRKRKPMRREYPLFPEKIYISYTQYKQLKELTILSRPVAYSGLKPVEVKERKKIFGSLATSTLGNAKKSELENGKILWDTYGLEKTYDEYLRGEDGTGHSYNSIRTIDVPPVDGKDIQTTINTDMQDICENALLKKLKEHDGLGGWAILMEVKSGDIKAIVNLTKVGDGQYIETYEPTLHNTTENHALSRLMEPGSIFKTVAMAAALEDGLLKPQDSVLTYGGNHLFYGKNRKDDVAPLEGQKKYGINDVLMHSSNVGMIQMVAEKYGESRQHQKFIETIKRFGINENYKLITSEVTPRIPDISKIVAKDVTLMTMSYGYSVNMTAINILNFYNTIANNGTQVAPRLVKAITKDGEVIKEFPTRILRENVLSETTVNTLKGALYDVVNGWSRKRTGKRAQSEIIDISGKTGTARVLKNGTYEYQPMERMFSFCGFFPSEEPLYSCIVQVHSNHVGGGGSVAAPVLKEIAEKVTAKRVPRPIDEAKDTVNSNVPLIKCGNINAANYILNKLEISDNDYNDDLIWGSIVQEENGNTITEERELHEGLIPNVVGMGAKDAVYLLKRAGVKTRITGYGTVKHQSIRGGEKATPGTTVYLTLKP